MVRTSEQLVFRPQPEFPEILVQRWLSDGRVLTLVQQICNWQVTLSASGDARGWEEAY